jgi:hypothetical protein
LVFGLQLLYSFLDFNHNGVEFESGYLIWRPAFRPFEEAVDIFDACGEHFELLFFLHLSLAEFVVLLENGFVVGVEVGVGLDQLVVLLDVPDLFLFQLSYLSVK